MLEKINLNFHVHTKVDICAKFQHSKLIFIFVDFYSCYQLLTADDSSREEKIIWIFIYHLKIVNLPNLSSVDWLVAWLDTFPGGRVNGQVDGQQLGI